MHRVARTVASCPLGGCGPWEEASLFDLVVAEGRVMDPESGLDGIRWVGIRDGRIVALSETPLRGTDTLNAAGLIVGPGISTSTPTARTRRTIASSR
jgi:hypothetical protein